MHPVGPVDPADSAEPALPTPSVRPTDDDLRELLRGVIDPELHDNIVDLGMLRAATIDGAGVVTVTLALTTLGCPLRATLKGDIERRLAGWPGVTDIRMVWDELNALEKTRVMERARSHARDTAPDTQVPIGTRVLAIASGKGGVGKSSVTSNLAAVLAQRGLTVGVMDADIWGFSVPRMLGVAGRLSAEKHEAEGRAYITPLEKKVGPGLIKLVSTGSIVDDEGTALMWRGLMLTKAVEQFLRDVRWGELDVLLVDMPPGTGDVQMGLARMLPQAEMVVVTTPALAAQVVAGRAADMARRSHMPIAGIIENMSAFTCDHGVRYSLFGEGGGQRLADEIGVALLGQVPLEPAVATGGDTGEPVALGDGPAAEAFRAIAQALVPADDATAMAGCSARMLASVASALSASDGPRDVDGRNDVDGPKDVDGRSDVSATEAAGGESTP